jgi:hypothetical protein
VVLGFLALLVGPAAPASAQPAAEKPKLVCREGESQLGSHVRTGRRCLTRDQWDEEDARQERRPANMEVTDHQSDASEPATRPQ